MPNSENTDTARGPDASTGSHPLRVVLASGSPRRLDLLRCAGIAPRVEPADIDETPLKGETPEEYVARLAEEKAAAVQVDLDDVVIAADTTVDLDGRILGKPEDAAAVLATLTALSGRQHLVHTGFALRFQDVSSVQVVTTIVEFADLDPQMIEWYTDTGEPYGKAGAYALQGAGACLVAGVQGSVSNVIGLPLVEVLDMVRERCPGIVPGIYSGPPEPNAPESATAPDEHDWNGQRPGSPDV